MPKISVIMLTYNRERFVGRAIDSMLAQTLADFEFIIVDNGSSDQSGVIADAYAARDDRIRVIHSCRKNIGGGRNAGLGAACGEYIAFIDDDDIAEPDFLAFLYELAEGYGADVSICGSWRKSGNCEATPKYIYDELLLHDAAGAVAELIFRTRYNSGLPTKLFRAALFCGTRFPRESQYEDIATTYKLFSSAKLIVARGNGKYTAMRHGGNNSSAATAYAELTPSQLDEYLGAFQERTEYISRKLPQLAELARWSEWSYMISMVEKINRHNLANCAEMSRRMTANLLANREAFLSAKWTRPFEKKWVGEFVK
jgi:glycosyltransferase involved in cell wall biosynthesis